MLFESIVLFSTIASFTSLLISRVCSASYTATFLISLIRSSFLISLIRSSSTVPKIRIFLLPDIVLEYPIDVCFRFLRTAFTDDDDCVDANGDCVDANGDCVDVNGDNCGDSDDDGGDGSGDCNGVVDDGDADEVDVDEGDSDDFDTRGNSVMGSVIVTGVCTEVCIHFSSGCLIDATGVCIAVVNGNVMVTGVCTEVRILHSSSV